MLYRKKYNLCPSRFRSPVRVDSHAFESDFVVATQRCKFRVLFLANVDGAFMEA